MTEDGHEKTMQVTNLSHVALILRLLGCFRPEGGRIVLFSSDVHEPDKNGFEKIPPLIPTGPAEVEHLVKPPEDDPAVDAFGHGLHPSVRQRQARHRDGHIRPEPPSAAGRPAEEHHHRGDEPRPHTGRLVLQELAAVVGAAEGTGVGGKDSGIELQVHDFFTPQPVEGARAYFMRSVLYDWPDEQCRTILGDLRDVIEPGYSKILISDCVGASAFPFILANLHSQVLADEKAAWQHLSLDLTMMAQVSSQERTEQEWCELIESCALKIAGIYNKGERNEDFIEAVLK